MSREKRILFDIVHPAHVHFFKNILWGLESKGHKTAIAARDKEVTLELLDRYALPYQSLTQASAVTLWQRFGELLVRDWRLLQMCRSFKPDIICSRNPSGVQVARLLGIPGFFDTDDGPKIGLHYSIAAPFASVITTPQCLKEDCGPKHIRYPGYKQSAYLHPDHFSPNPEVLGLLGLQPGERFFVVRFVAMNAIHDRTESGLGMEEKKRLISRLQGHGRVFISSEGPLPEMWQHLQISLPAHLVHDILAFADLLVGDSQTMAMEAACLGTPSLRVNSMLFTSNLDDLEKKYGLVYSFSPDDSVAFFSKLDSMLSHPNLKQTVAGDHQRMLDDTVNVAEWYQDLILKHI
jgi:uncharacterized protein